MSLIHWWPLNGNLKDYGIKNFTLTGNATVNNSGKIGKCYSFNGSNTYLRAEYPNTTKPGVVSIAAWYKANSIASGKSHYILNCYESGGAGLASGDVNIKMQVYCNGNYYNTMSAIPDTNWHHWCGTFDGRYIKLYMDGVLKNTYDMGNTYSISYEATTPWMIGANPNTAGNPAGNYTDGVINDVRLYDHALSLKEVKEISKGLVLHYTFEDAYAEGTTNIISSVTSSNAKLPAAGNGVDLQTTSGDAYCSLRLSSALVNGATYTLSFDVSNLKSGESVSFGFYDSGMHNTTSIHNGKTTITFTAWNSASNLTFDDGSRNNTTVVSLRNFQLEQKDHATPYVNGTRQPGLIYDSSGNGYNGTPTGAIQILQESVNGQHVINFPANTCYVKLPALNTGGFANSYTFSWWAKKTDMGNCMAWGFSDGNRLNLYPSNSVFCWNTGDGSSNQFKNNGTAVAYAPYNNGWHLFSVTGDGTTAKLYIDGELKGNAMTYKALTGSQIYISGWDTGTSYKWVGKIADFKIYATALSAADILAEYNRKASIDRDGNLYTGEFVEENDRINIAKTDVVEASVFEEGTSLVKMTDKYVELEYIQSDGNQVIDTGYNMTSNNLIFEDVYEYAALTSNEACIGGTSTGSSSPGFEFGNTASKFFNYSSTHTTSAYGPGTPATNTKYYYRAFISATEYSCEINGVLGTPVSKTISITGQRVRINRYYGSGHNLNGKQYLIRIWDNGVLVRNFIPAKRKSDNVIGMYDTVNRQFYTNSGSGSFTAGPEKGNLSIVYSKQIIEN